MLSKAPSSRFTSPVRHLGRLLLLPCLLLGLSPAATGQPSRTARPAVAGQIEALLAEKSTRTGPQRKISSRLLYTARMRRGVPVAPGVPTLRSTVELDAQGRTLVDLRAEVDAGLLERIATLGGRVVHASPAHGSVRARLPIDRLEALAGLPQVRSLRPADRAVTRAVNVSQGDVAHRADLARAALGVDGSGITVGVLSDGVDSLASLQGSGDLPAGVTVLPGQAGSGSEGTAMLEIVHDLAPGAALLFATAFNGQASFAQNILGLRAAGADVIVDDVGYFAEAVFQDDDVAAAVDQVTANGALYFSAAGNGGNLNDGRGGVWEGDFASSGTTLQGGLAHQFAAGQIGNEIALASPFVYTLHWNDPQGTSANDYDLFLVNKPMTVIFAASTDVQDGDDDPYEAIGAAMNDKGRRLVIVRNAGSSRVLHLNANRGRLARATAGQISGHPAARGATAVAAVGVGSSGGAFDGSESVQTYSSDGPRRVFYEADGMPITPADLTSSGGELRSKPDLAAADCVSTATPGFATFCGTSAGAPHAAAVAALLLDLGQGSGLAPGDVLAALSSSALDIEGPGFDRDSGAGIADALGAANLLAGTCSDGIDNDGDGSVDFPSDPGCTALEDASERSPQLACDDGVDNDGDGRIDFDPLTFASPGDSVTAPAGEGDPGCASPGATLEAPSCQNGVDDPENPEDLLVDYDGGFSITGVSGQSPDPECIGQPWRHSEGVGCGLGPGLAPLIATLLWRRGRRRAEEAGPDPR